MASVTATLSKRVDLAGGIRGDMMNLTAMLAHLLAGGEVVMPSRGYGPNHKDEGNWLSNRPARLGPYGIEIQRPNGEWHQLFTLPADGYEELITLDGVG